MTDVSTLLIRADASTEIGTGHVMRCLALAQAWQQSGGSARFVFVSATPGLEARLKAEGMETTPMTLSRGSTSDAMKTIEIAQETRASWVVADGYQFGAAYQRVIKDAGLRLLLLDDYGHASHYYADLVLNQNIYADEALYSSHEPYTRMLLGTRYTLLRHEFWSWRNWTREIPKVARRVLVTLGGGDPANVTLKVIEAMDRTKEKDLEVVVLVGDGNPHLHALQAAVCRVPFAIHLLRNAANMPELMTWADFAVSAGGSTCWELAFLGCPSVMLILADNQRLNAEHLHAIGAVVNLGWHESISAGEVAQSLTGLLRNADQRAEMARRSRELVDGKGSTRVLYHLGGKALRLRQVREDDCRLLWEWVNDPDVREASFSPEPIPWGQHVKWFEQKVGDPTCVMYIASDCQNVPVGQIRYDINGIEATVSVSVGEQFRDQGLGSEMIRKACARLFAHSGVNIINAYTKPHNEASIRAFVKAGFRVVGTVTFSNQRAMHLILRSTAG